MVVILTLLIQSIFNIDQLLDESCLFKTIENIVNNKYRSVVKEGQMSTLRSFYRLVIIISHLLIWSHVNIAQFLIRSHMNIGQLLISNINFASKFSELIILNI